MSRLRSYAPMKKESRKVAAEAGAFQAVYQAVDLRSEGRCEVTTAPEAITEAAGPFRMAVLLAHGARCPKRGVEHDHLFKPRRAHHTADQVIHICRAHHDRKDWPFKRGRLCYVGRMGTAFLFAIRYASDKPFRASGPLAP